MSCEKEMINKIDVSEIEVNTVVERFDQLFYSTPPNELNLLKARFPYLFPEPNHDSIWVNKMQNEDEQALFAAVSKVV